MKNCIFIHIFFVLRIAKIFYKKVLKINEPYGIIIVYLRIIRKEKIVEKLKRIALNSCAFTVLISALFFAFAKITGLSEVKIDFLHFFVILLFGTVIATTNTVFELPKLHIALKVLIHYVVLLVAFYIVFINFGNVKSSGISTVFVVVVVFSFLYLLISVLTWLIKRAFKKSNSVSNRTKNVASKKNNDKYTPRFN